MPFGVAGRWLAVDDDVQFRRALRALHAAHLEEVAVLISIPVLQSAETRRPPGWRPSHRTIRPVTPPRAAGLLGVIGLARFVTETQEREALLSSTVLNFRRAIDLHPANDEAKVNLELAYQRGRGVEINESSGGQNPTLEGEGRGAQAPARPVVDTDGHTSSSSHPPQLSSRWERSCPWLRWLWCAGVRGACGACSDSPSLRPVESASRSSQ